MDIKNLHPASILIFDKNIKYICIKKYQKQIHPVQLLMYNIKTNTNIYFMETWSKEKQNVGEVIIKFQAEINSNFKNKFLILYLVLYKYLNIVSSMYPGEL